jgi:very-short-patch-repair endonuclease
VNERRIEVEREVQRVLRQQHWLITTKQAEKAGLNRPALARRVAAGRMEKVTRGLYRDASHPATDHQSALAPILIHSTWAGAAFETAAWLQGVDGYRLPTRIDIAVAATAPHTSPLATVHPVFGLRRTDVRNVAGVPCVRPPLTLLQIAAHRSFDEVELDFIDLACRGLTSTRAVLSMLDRFAMPGRNGVVVLRQVAERWDGKRLPGSRPEVKLGRILEAAGFTVAYQEEIEVRGRKKKYADLRIAGHPIVVEFQSEKHHAVRKAMRHDSTRSLLITAAGFHVLPASQDDIDNNGVNVVAAIRSLQRRAA